MKSSLWKRIEAEDLSADILRRSSEMERNWRLLIPWMTEGIGRNACRSSALNHYGDQLKNKNYPSKA
jgi:hypothetical protein